MKRQAAQAAKEEKKDQKKAELERKKAAKVTTKKTLTVATKMCGALTNCWNSAAPTAMKAKELGLPDVGDVAKLVEVVDQIDGWRKLCTQALNFYTKNANCELDAFDFTMEEASQSIKDCQKLVKVVKTHITEATKKQKEEKAAAKAAAKCAASSEVRGGGA